MLGLLAGLLLWCGLATLPLGGGTGYLGAVWAFHPDEQPGAVLGLGVGAAVLWVLGSGLWAARRRAWWAWGLPLCAPVLLSWCWRFDRARGDPWHDLIEYTVAWEQGGWLFVGGEMLGHLWFVLVGALSPLDGADTVFLAARLSGLLGLVGLLVLGRALARDVEPVRQTLACTLLLVSPTTLLLLGYPQSTGLMLGLVPLYLGVGVHLTGGARGWHWPLAGVLLALSCASHGSAFFLGLGALVLVVLGSRGRKRWRGLGFALGFLGAWLPLALLERALSVASRARGHPWALLHPEFHWQGLADQLGGPVGVLGPSRFFQQSWPLELWCWLCSATPAALLAVPLGLVGLLLLRRRPAGPVAFLAAGTAGTALLWASWESWYRYPGDWDVTAVAALCLTPLGIALLLRLPPRLGTFMLGLLVPVSAWVTLHLGLRFVG